MNIHINSLTLPFARQTPRFIHPKTGDIVTAANLPEPHMRWSSMRKVILVLAVRNRLLSLEDALKRYSITSDEFSQFCALYDSYGSKGLRISRSRMYPLEVGEMPQNKEASLPDNISVGDVTINRTTGSVVVAGRSVHCTKKQFNVLELLMVNAGTVVTRKMIMKHLYEDCGTLYPDSGTLNVFVCKLRKILSGENGFERIETVWGRGYRFAKPR